MIPRDILGLYAGVRLIESVNATALPKGKPFTDDMKMYVEAMERMAKMEEQMTSFYGLGAAMSVAANSTLCLSDTLSSIRRIKEEFDRGTRFFSFKETPEDHFFMWDGFKPMRSLN